MIKVKFNRLVPMTFTIITSGLMIPKATSIVVTTKSSQKTNQIRLTEIPDIILSLWAYGPMKLFLLDQVEEGEDEDPHQVYKVPVQSNFFDHAVVSSALVSPQQDVVENYEVDHHT